MRGAPYLARTQLRQYAAEPSMKERLEFTGPPNMVSTARLKGARNADNSTSALLCLPVHSFPPLLLSAPRTTQSTLLLLLLLVLGQYLLLPYICYTTHHAAHGTRDTATAYSANTSAYSATLQYTSSCITTAQLAPPLPPPATTTTVSHVRRIGDPCVRHQA